ncbi:MAG TPA: hypothetical protein VJC20_02730 [Candidatus Paceibacterota bacterium]
MSGFERTQADLETTGGENRSETTAQKIDFAKTLSREQGIMQKLRGKARDLVGGFMVLTAVTLGEGALQQASAAALDVGKGESVEEFEDREAAEERAVAFLEKLIKASAGDDITNPAQKRLMAQRAAWVMIQGFAAQEKNIKEGKPKSTEVHITFRDICDALGVLNGASGEFIQRHYKSDIGEAQRQMATNPGLHTLMEKSAQCK